MEVEAVMSENNLPSSKKTQVPAAWKSNSVGLENRRIAQQNLSLRHGLFSSIPIICQGSKCPYFGTCFIDANDLQIGERCPIEIGAIVDRFDKYCTSLGVDPDNPMDIVDAGLVKDIVDIEVMMLRADSLLATSATFIEEVVAGISPKGKEYQRPELHRAAEYKDTLRKDKIRLLNELHATRKSKKHSNLDGSDPSSVAARIIAKVQNLQKEGKIIDVTPEEDNDIETNE